jgi:hypothetical protein
MLYAGQKALLAASEAAWWPLWQNPRAPKWDRVNSPRKAAGWRPQPFTGHELWELCWSVAPGKAPGHDGWQVRRMRQWPPAVWELVAQLLAAVEEASCWPRQLRQGVVCLLPKAGVQATTCTPLEARPVVLLSMIYRMWARRRGRELGRWLVENGMEGLPDLSRSAEDYGTLLTAEFERAEVLGEPVLAVCVDQSKAYDMVRLDLLEFLLEGSGLPRQVWQPNGTCTAEIQSDASRGGRASAHLRLHPRLPCGHFRYEPFAGEVAARPAQRLPVCFHPVLGGRQHCLSQGSGTRPGCVGGGHPGL